MIDVIVALLALAGAAFALIGSIGLVRFPDVFTRLHGPTKATTLGVGAVLLASVVFFAGTGPGSLLRPILVALFLFITAPISAHLLGKAALHRKSKSLAPLPSEEE